MADMTFPNFGIPFPYQNLIQQLQASMQNPTPGSYGRWGGTGLMAGMPGASGGGSGPAPAAPLPGAVQGPAGTYPMPKAPQYIDPNRQAVGGITPNAPNYFLDPNQTNAVGPGGGVPTAGTNAPNPGMPTNGAPMAKPLDSNLKMAQVSPPQMPQGGLLGQSFQIGKQLDPSLASNAVGQRFIAGFNKMNPVFDVTASDFNKLNAVDPAQAFKLASAGGQPFINSIMAQNGMNWDQMRQWLNNAGYGQGGLEARGLDPALLRSLGIR